MATLILLACYGFIIWLFRKDMAWRKAGSMALLIPGAWIAIQGSRPIAYWFGGDGGSEANPITTFTFALFLIVTLVVLMRRGISPVKVIARNQVLILLYIFLLISALWAESAFVSMKRLIKDFECVLVALIFLTEVNPAAAIRAVFVRVSYILFPLSVVFIKWFPQIGRAFSRAGEAMFTGVTTQKNTLGETVFVFGLFIIWDMVEIWKEKNRKGRDLQLLIRFGMLAIGMWLLMTCDSKTSLLCLILGTAVFWGASQVVKMKAGRPILMTTVITVAILALMDSSLGLTDMVIRALGRDPDLTGRTDIWELVLNQNTNPLVGQGFYMFWDSSKGEAVIDSFMRINSAHNGYLETYLDGGIIGVALLVLFLLVAGGTIINRLFAGHPLGKIGLVFWLMSILYNFSESSFFRLDVLWFTLILVSIACPLPHRREAQSPTYVRPVLPNRAATNFNRMPNP